MVFSNKMLTWPALQPAYLGEQGKGVWHVTQDCKFIEYWHDTALRSTGFGHVKS